MQKQNAAISIAGIHVALQRSPSLITECIGGWHETAMPIADVKWMPMLFLTITRRSTVARWSWRGARLKLRTCSTRVYIYITH